MIGLARLVTSARALRSNRTGVAAAEFALIAPVMVALLLGVYDIGNAIQQRLQLEQAVRAGAQYALSWPDELTSSESGVVNSIPAAVSAALPSSWTNATVNASYCHSSGDGTQPTPVQTPSCPATCGPASTTETYVTICATNPSTPFYISAVAGNSATYVVRVQ
jgi:Flp pilus assembly protein TadG